MFGLALRWSRIQMMRFRWNQPCAADGCWLTSTGNAAERGMVPEGIHA